MIDLRPSSDTGLHREALAIVRDFPAEHVHELRTFGPWAHNRHVALHHIPQLRQFIEPKLPKPATKRCNARVASLAPPRPCSRLSISVHRAEFVQGEDAPVHPNPA